MRKDKVKMLVIDDEEGIVDYVCKIFERRGFEVNGAINGEEALRLFDEKKPQLVLLDVHLGASIDGIEVLRSIKEMKEDTLCIMFTRVTHQDKVEAARALGARHYIRKPLDARELVDIVLGAAEDLKS